MSDFDYETPRPTRAIVVHPALRLPRGGAHSRDPEACLEEAVGLAAAIHLDICAEHVVPLTQVRPATYLGAGSVERLAQEIEADEVDLVVIDTHLSAIQQRNLEKALNAKVIDRTALILEIFGARARTREGVLQVELAHLTYQRSRLVRSWTHLERQRGGLGAVGGPGETQIELDRRRIDERIDRLKRDLEDVRRTRDLHRKARRRVPYPIIALVGYTNAGKSTFFNQLTNAHVFAKDQLFATLDPTMRSLELPSGRKVILSDTVGFVSNLPHELVAAFHATLEEVLEADLVVHVRDISHPDTQAQKADVETVLKELGMEKILDAGVIEALNQIDRLGPEDHDRIRAASSRQDRTIAVSALTGEGIPEALALFDHCLDATRVELELDVSLADGATLAWLYDHGEIFERTDKGMTAHLKVRLDPEDRARFEHRLATDPKSD